jgi:hypothetical protein
MNAGEALGLLDNIRDLMEKPEVEDDALAELDGFLNYDKFYEILHDADSLVFRAMEMISEASSERLMDMLAERENARYAASVIA